MCLYHRRCLQPAPAHRRFDKRIQARSTPPSATVSPLTESSTLSSRTRSPLRPLATRGSPPSPPSTVATGSAADGRRYQHRHERQRPHPASSTSIRGLPGDSAARRPSHSVGRCVRRVGRTGRRDSSSARQRWRLSTSEAQDVRPIVHWETVRRCPHRGDLLSRRHTVRKPRRAVSPAPSDRASQPR